MIKAERLFKLMAEHNIVECEVTKDTIKATRSVAPQMVEHQIPVEPWTGEPLPENGESAEPPDFDIEIDNSAAMPEDQEVYSDRDLWGGGEDPVAEKNEREKALKARLKQKRKDSENVNN